ncbi:MAG: hypothetical protein AAFV62_01385 [Pseudomonadota bacterium]
MRHTHTSCGRFARLALALVTGLAAVPALACDEPVSLDNAQVRELVTLIKTDGADALDQIFGFETLMCAKRPAVRDHATRAALGSSNPTLQASVLFELLFAKEGIVIEYIVEEGQSKEYYKFVETTPMLQLNLGAKNRAESCIAINARNGQPDCANARAWNMLQVSGTRVTLALGDSYTGNFTLQGTALVGTLAGERVAVDKKPLGAVPAKINLID